MRIQPPPQEHHPVVVVGAGPGGCATALALVRRGIRVTLLEKARFPRDKVCGDVLLPAAIESLEALGLPIRELEARVHPNTGCRYRLLGSAEVSATYRDHHGRARASWTMPRHQFDAWLASHTRLAGARLLEEETVTEVVPGNGSGPCCLTVRQRDGTVRGVSADFVVGADGASSAVARDLGCLRHPPEHTCVALRTYAHGVRLPDPFLEIFTAPHLLPGCAWILPVGPETVNVGLGVLKSTAQRLGSNPAALFRQALESMPTLRQRMEGARWEPWRGWHLPGATEQRVCGKGRVLLVGDAGAMVDPFTGHGIHHALQAGRLAGSILADHLSGSMSGDPATRYANEVAALLGREIIPGSQLQRLHARPGLVRLALPLARIHPGLRSLMMALVGHSAERHELLSPRNLIASCLQLSEKRVLV